jgi:protein TonB
MKSQSIFIFLMLISMTTFGQIEKSTLELKPQIATEIPLVLADFVFRIVDEMPIFPACDSLENYVDRKACADKTMLNFIYKNLRWPAGGPCVEGTAVISFVIEEDGSITNAKIIRDPGADCGEEALRLVNLLPNFEPGKIDEKPVRVQYNLPIRFRLE